MTIYTSSFLTYKGNRGVNIAVSKPDWISVYKSIPILKPEWKWVDSWNKVKKLPDTNTVKNQVRRDYTDYYLAILESIGIERILQELEEGDVLLCWCNKNDFCHRQLLAIFLRSHGITVIEL